MGFFSRIRRKPTVVPDAATTAQGNVVPFVTRRTEITVEREWVQMSVHQPPNVSEKPSIKATPTDTDPRRQK